MTISFLWPVHLINLLIFKKLLLFVRQQWKFLVFSFHSRTSQRWPSSIPRPHSLIPIPVLILVTFGFLDSECSKKKTESFQNRSRFWVPNGASLVRLRRKMMNLIGLRRKMMNLMNAIHFNFHLEVMQEHMCVYGLMFCDTVTHYDRPNKKNIEFPVTLWIFFESVTREKIFMEKFSIHHRRSI